MSRHASVPLASCECSSERASVFFATRYLVFWCAALQNTNALPQLGFVAATRLQPWLVPISTGDPCST